MRPPRHITKKRNRRRKQLRCMLIHSAGCVYSDCAEYQVGREPFTVEEPDHLEFYFIGSARHVMVPRSLRCIHGATINSLQ